MSRIKKFTLKNFFVFLVLLALSILIVFLGVYYFSSSIYDTKLKEIKTKIEFNAKSIESLTASLEQKTTELADFGSMMHVISDKFTKEELDKIFSTYLVKSFLTFSDAMGGGIWFEPHSILKNEKYYGPYVFREKNEVKFTWDLSTAEYNYHGWDWYEMALPKNHNRTIKRDKLYYWSAPYKDGAGSGALMITVDAFMYDKNKNIIGISTVDWGLNDMLKYIEESRPTIQTHSFLIDNESSLVLLNTINPTSIMQKFSDDAVLKSIVNDKKERTVNVGNKQFQVLFIQTSNKMTYGILTPTEELMVEQNSAILISILITIVLTSLFYFIYINVITKLQQIIKDKTETLVDSLNNIQERQQKISILLDNAGQGFLTFDKNFKIDDEYSRECIKLLGENIASEDVATLLFQDKIKQEFFKSTLLDAQNESMEIKRNAYLSLLPAVIILNKRAIKLEYKILEDGNFMLILTNVSSQKRLENKIKKEQEVFKMIVSIVSETQIFYDTKDEYLKFINSLDTLINDKKSIQENLSDIYRAIHTFKGAFSQLYMEDVVQVLHNIESEIAELSKENEQNSDRLRELLNSTDLRTSFEASLTLVKDVLGVEFLDSHNFVKIDLSNIQSLQEKIAKVFSQKGMASIECQDILTQVQTLSGTKLYALLKPYIALVSQLATRFEKEIYELGIDGDVNLVAPEKIKPFIKSLMHVFRNSIDHGIELPEERLELEKDEKGTIVCKFEQVENSLKIIISDDGIGIDVEKIKEKLQSQDIDTTNLTHEEFYNFIFENEFTTKAVVTDISGRGVGMSVVKAELDKLGGTVDIKSEKNVGTTFMFVLPL